jgi:hypothetical protein
MLPRFRGYMRSKRFVTISEMLAESSANGLDSCDEPAAQDRSERSDAVHQHGHGMPRDPFGGQGTAPVHA